ncbi:hypothetical protein P885DRAFT_65639 [Corynascus similis CBS 632.67]
MADTDNDYDFDNDSINTPPAFYDDAKETVGTAIPGGESGYEPWYPSNIATDSSVKEFVTRFFQVSDDAGRDEEWVELFDEGATVIIGNDEAKGRADIRKLRKRMWKDVEERKHRVVKVFPANFTAEVASLNEVEYMLFGAVAYRLREGKGEAVAGWAGHAQLKRDSLTAPWRIVFYRVYIQR